MLEGISITTNKNKTEFDEQQRQRYYMYTMKMTSIENNKTWKRTISVNIESCNSTPEKSRSFWTIFPVKLNEAWWFKLVLILWWFLLGNIYCNSGIFGGHNFLTVLFLHLAHVEDFLISTCERLKHLFLPTRSGNTRRENNNMWNVSNGM